jgi:hypothetical protein
MISLAKKMGRREMTGFLVASGLLSFVLGMICFGLFFDSWPWAALASGAAARCYVGAGLYSEAFSIWVYRRWNQVAQKVAFLVRWWVSSIAFHVIVRVVGRLVGDYESQRHVGRGGLSGGSVAPRLGSVRRTVQSGVSDAEGEGWVEDYLRWCFMSGNGWLVFPPAIPFGTEGASRESARPKFQKMFTRFTDAGRF